MSNFNHCKEEKLKKMTTKEELEIGIGTEETITLKPLTVVIKEINVEEIGEKKAKKVVCSVQHPDKLEPVKISSVKWESGKGKLEISGLWLNKDSKGQIRKGSALAVFMQMKGAKVLGDLVMKSSETVLDEKGYLALKAY